MNKLNKQSFLAEEQAIYKMPVSVAIIYVTEISHRMSSCLTRQVST